MRRWGPKSYFEGYVQFESKNLLSLYTKKTLDREEEATYKNLPPKIRHSLMRLDVELNAPNNVMSVSWENSEPERIDDIIGIRELYTKLYNDAFVRGKPKKDKNTLKYKEVLVTKNNGDEETLDVRYEPFKGLPDSLLVSVDYKSFIYRNPRTPPKWRNDSLIKKPSQHK